MNIGARVVIVQDRYGDRNGWEKIGRSGQIVRYSYSGGSGKSLSWDVKLDEPMPDGREYLWFSTSELQVI